MKKLRLGPSRPTTKAGNRPRLIANEIRTAIYAGHLKPGDILPSVRDAAEEWKETKESVHRAYKLLREEGVLVDSDDRGSLPGYMVDPEAEQPSMEERKARLEHVLTQAMVSALATVRKMGHSTLEFDETAPQVLEKLQRSRRRAAKKSEAPTGSPPYSRTLPRGR